MYIAYLRSNLRLPWVEGHFADAWTFRRHGTLRRREEASPTDISPLGRFADGMSRRRLHFRIKRITDVGKRPSAKIIEKEGKEANRSHRPN